MALFVNQNGQRTQLQEKLAAELKTKLSNPDIRAEDTPPAILEDAHQTRPAGMIIIVLLALVAAGIVALVIFMR